MKEKNKKNEENERKQKQIGFSMTKPGKLTAGILKSKLRRNPCRSRYRDREKETKTAKGETKRDKERPKLTVRNRRQTCAVSQKEKRQIWFCLVIFSLIQPPTFSFLSFPISFSTTTTTTQTITTGTTGTSTDTTTFPSPLVFSLSQLPISFTFLRLCFTSLCFASLFFPFLFFRLSLSDKMFLFVIDHSNCNGRHREEAVVVLLLLTSRNQTS